MIPSKSTYFFLNEKNEKATKEDDIKSNKIVGIRLPVAGTLDFVLGVLILTIVVGVIIGAIVGVIVDVIVGVIVFVGVIVGVIILVGVTVVADEDAE
jgi:hypothetical protein